MSELPRVIPLFPLGDVVLFPRMPLPLHIFEPRYRKMVADAMNGPRVIGMTLLQPGWESDYEGRPAVYPGGCAGQIERCDPLPDGRYNVVLQGVARFRIQEEHDGQPYRLATVEALSDGLGDPAALDDARRRVLDLVGRAADAPVVVVSEPQVPHEILANALCQSLSLDPLEKQSLLECDTVLDRYRRLLELLEFRLLERVYRRGGTTPVH